MVLVAVMPPDHVLHCASRAQDELFRRYGLASTRALPPVIPVGRENATERGDPSRALAASAWTLPAFQVGSVCVRDGHLVADTTLEAACAQLADFLGLTHPVKTAARGEPSLPPGCLILGEVETEASPEVPTSPFGATGLFAGLIHSASLIRIQIETDPSTPHWWHSVRWCITDSRRLRASVSA